MEPNENMNGVVETGKRLEAVWHALESVTDPEIPVLNVVDMGIIADVRFDQQAVVIDMTPTFVGCPALDVIRDNIKSAVTAAGEPEVSVRVVYDPPWTSERISEEGRRKLKEFGFAPPMRCERHEGTKARRHGEETSERRQLAVGAGTGGQAARGTQPVPISETVPCPFCDSSHTEMESIFGPTLCRSIHYCHDCLQSFEHFKTV